MIPPCDWQEAMELLLWLVGGNGSLAGVGRAVDPLCCVWSEAAAPCQDWGRQSLLGLVGNGSFCLGLLGAVSPLLGLVGRVVVGRAMALINPALTRAPHFPTPQGVPAASPHPPQYHGRRGRACCPALPTPPTACTARPAAASFCCSAIQRARGRSSPGTRHLPVTHHPPVTCPAIPCPTLSSPM